MIDVYCIRHGKTEYNAKNIFQGGGVDSPLLNEEVMKITKLGEKISHLHFEKVFISPQKRAIETFKIVKTTLQNRQSLECKTELMREMSFGLRDGQKIEKFIQDEQYLLYLNNPKEYNPSSFNGESYYDLIKRCHKFENQIREDVSNGNVLLVGHGVFLTVFINSLIGKKIDEIRGEGVMNNGSLSKISLSENNASLEFWNQ